MRRSLTIAALLAACLIPVLAAPVAAFPLSTCTLSIESTDGSGAPLDTAQSGAPDSTASDPFKVDWDGNLIDFGKKVEVPMRALALELIEFVDDVVDELGSRRFVEYVHTILRDGTSADRQLRVYRETSDLRAVVQHVVTETCPAAARAS